MSTKTKKTVAKKNVRKPFTRPVTFYFRNKSLTERGGITVVYNPATNKFGVAVCQRMDSFNKKEGFKRACGRSLSTDGVVYDAVQPSSTFAKIKQYATRLAKASQQKFNDHVGIEIGKIVKAMSKNMLDVILD